MELIKMVNIKNNLKVIPLQKKTFMINIWIKEIWQVMVFHIMMTLYAQIVKYMWKYGKQLLITNICMYKTCILEIAIEMYSSQARY